MIQALTEQLHESNSTLTDSLISPLKKSSRKATFERNENDPVETPISLSLHLDELVLIGDKRVRFAPLNEADIHLIPTCYEFEQEEIDTLWYSRNDFQALKHEQRVLAKRTRIKGTELTKPIDNVYQQAKKLALVVLLQQQDKTHLEVEDSMLHKLKVQEITHALCQWAQRKLSCRGLEHWTSRHHYGMRTQRKEAALYVVLGDHISAVVEDPQACAEAYAAEALPSRLLAHWLAVADAQYQIPAYKAQQLQDEIMNAYRNPASATVSFATATVQIEGNLSTLASFHSNSNSNNEEQETDSQSSTEDSVVDSIRLGCVRSREADLMFYQDSSSDEAEEKQVE